MANRPHYLLTVNGGILLDTRQPDYATNPLRAVFSQAFRDISNTAELRATLRAGQFTDIGGYPRYFITADGGTLSFDSVRKNLREVLDAIRTDDRHGGWRVVACDVNWENAELVCDHSAKRIPSAYGDDESEG